MRRLHYAKCTQSGATSTGLVRNGGFLALLLENNRRVIHPGITPNHHHGFYVAGFVDLR
jgi:hypothetical protein